ncbi:LysR family transcriptional regulator [Patulibacter sp.]|uniref:LysR family transcriptional regulator n=1 Tax=Patulibacter sp. TaxID=1912859 RepID=UPI00271E95B7|nr:LysR family transcriptional regulator [Patulibacter sp.]MDO9409643.1 LysR family transcriptional regulator [Patulibacter sp.]
MDIAQLRCFVAVSRERNIGKAAESLHLTPSPVSRTIRQLERQLEVELFDRRYHELFPTEAAAALLPRVVAILAQFDDLLVPAADPRPIRVGVTPWAPTRFAARLGDGLRDLGEPVTRVEAEMSSILLRQLSHGDLDLAVVHLPVDLPGIDVRALARYRFYVFGPADSDLPDTSVALSALRGRKAVVLPMILQPKPMKALVDKLMAAGVAEIEEIGFAEVLTLESRLRSTGAIMLGNRATDTPISQMIERTALRATPLDLDDIDFEVGLAWRSSDPVRGARIQRLVDWLHPVGRPREIV